MIDSSRARTQNLGFTTKMTKIHRYLSLALKHLQLSVALENWNPDSSCSRQNDVTDPISILLSRFVIHGFKVGGPKLQNSTGSWWHLYRVSFINNPNGSRKIHEFWLDHFQLELAAHIWCVSSRHEYYLLVDYEFVTPSATAWTRTQFLVSLMWFIKETLVKLLCESLHFEHENHRKNIAKCSRRNSRIIPNKFLRGASAMKLRRMQRWFDRSPVNMFPEPVFTLDFSTKMSIIQWFLFQPYWTQSCRRAQLPPLSKFIFWK